MNKIAIVGGQEVEYSTRKHIRARRLRISIYPGGRCVVSMPRYMPERIAQLFMQKNAAWLLKSIQRLRNAAVPTLQETREHFEKYKAPALLYLTSRVQHYNQTLGCSVTRVSVRSQRTRWGSCSRKGRLNFNYRLFLLPEQCADYVVVHELCHLQEFNHSPRFWALVAGILPHYKETRGELRQHNPAG